MDGPLTNEDVDRGWKEIEVEDLAGRKTTIRLTAPGWRSARTIGLEFEQSQDSWTLIKPCLPEIDRTEKFLDKLTPQSIGELHTYAVAMLCGNGALKKNVAALGTAPEIPPTPLKVS